MNPIDIRKRTVEEDTLLGSRTGAFLIGNGFILTAFGANNEPQYQSVIAVFGIVISILWLLTSLQSYCVIHALHKNNNGDAIENIVREATFWKTKLLKNWFGPTLLVAIWLPSLVTLLWVTINYLLHFYS